MTSTILTGDALEMLKTIESGTVNTCVTSPPYYGLRQYLFDKAVIRRYNLSEEEVEYVESELRKHGVKPRM